MNQEEKIIKTLKQVFNKIKSRPSRELQIEYSGSGDSQNSFDYSLTGSDKKDYINEEESERLDDTLEILTCLLDPSYEKSDGGGGEIIITFAEDGKSAEVSLTGYVNVVEIKELTPLKIPDVNEDKFKLCLDLLLNTQKNNKKILDDFKYVIINELGASFYNDFKYGKSVGIDFDHKNNLINNLYNTYQKRFAQENLEEMFEICVNLKDPKNSTTSRHEESGDIEDKESFTKTFLLV